MDALYSGEVGYLSASIKQVSDARVGDTITLAKDPTAESLPGYQEPQAMVYCGLFPTDADQYQSLRTALGKLQLNDAALQFEPVNSPAMGFGFRCGFLGLLHMEIVQARSRLLDSFECGPSVRLAICSVVPDIMQSAHRFSVNNTIHRPGLQVSEC